MAIQTVTQENLADYVASRPQPSQMTSPEAVTQAVTTKEDGPTPGNPKISTGEEKLEGTPDPGPQLDPKEKPKKKSSVQDRIDELVKERHELDEAFQSEYEQRLRLEGELNALKSQAVPKTEEPKKDELGPEPKPSAYTDQEKFLSDWGAWQRKTARAEAAAELAQARAAEESARRDAAMQAKVAQAKKDFPDFAQVAQAAERRTRAVPNHIAAAFHDSDWGAHLAYHLMKDAEEEKRIFSLPPAKALLELGKIEDTFAKGKEPAAATTTPSVETPVTKQAPAPIARLGESAGIAPQDLSQPMSFKDYRRARLEQIRTSGRRRH